MNSVVMDTTIASFAFKASPLLALYQHHLQNANRIISFQTLAEMRLGAHLDGWGPKRRLLLNEFTSSLQIVVYSEELADCWVQMMSEARQAGRRLEAGDGWIAATALLLNAPLLTHDKDFDPTACPAITVYRFAP